MALAQKAMALAALILTPEAGHACQVSRPITCLGCPSTVHMQVPRGRSCGITFYPGLGTVVGGRVLSKPQLGRAGFVGQTGIIGYVAGDTGMVGYVAGAQPGSDTFVYELTGRDHLSKSWMSTVTVHVRVD